MFPQRDRTTGLAEDASDALAYDSPLSATQQEAPSLSALGEYARELIQSMIKARLGGRREFYARTSAEIAKVKDQIALQKTSSCAPKKIKWSCHCDGHIRELETRPMTLE